MLTERGTRSIISGQYEWAENDHRQVVGFGMTGMVTVGRELTESIGLFNEIAQTDIVAAGLLLMGSVLLGVSLLVFGILSVGAVVNEFKYRLFA